MPAWGGHSCPPPLKLGWACSRLYESKSKSKAADRSVRPTRLLPWNAARIQRNLTLDHHFQGCAGFHSHVTTAAQKSDRCADSAADSCADQSTFHAVAETANNRPGSRSRGYGLGFFAGLAVLADGAFFVFHRSLFRAGDILDRARQYHGV